tara:strand:- start:19 stop:204 length:186 start_codon:yes stop_codon:yes gene_type:complete
VGGFTALVPPKPANDLNSGLPLVRLYCYACAQAGATLDAGAVAGAAGASDAGAIAGALPET